MKEIASGTYVQAAKKIIPLFIGDELDAAMISSIIDKSYKEFSVRDVIDVKKLRITSYNVCYTKLLRYRKKSTR